MHKRVSNDYNFVQRELNILDFWKKNKIFQKCLDARKNAKNFTFFDGPPTANGKPHVGHVLTRAVKDLIPRYKTMKGYKVLRKAGWDTHGLPVELEVEKDLNLDGKEDIEKYGVENFIKKCKESVWRYEKDWKEMTERVAFWVDMENPYVTYQNNYIESVWWALKEIWEKGLLYNGYKVVPYCPRCGTSLSSHEVAQGYKDVKEESIYVKFAVKGEKNTYFLAWTTTPWTLPSNVALAINQKEKYVKIQVNNEIYILAKTLVNSVIGEEAKVLEEFNGKNLVGIEYEPLFDFIKPKKKAHYVVKADFVTLADGTGIVHIAPAFGEDDAKVGRENDLPFVQLVNEQGLFVDEVKPWKGMFVKDADPKIVKDLSDRGLLFKTQEYEHSYPFCWRCDTPLLYYARNSWFIKMTAVKEKLKANNQKINWLPDYIKDGRFGNFLDNVVDWGLSRERYWGTPLPIWTCECGYFHAIGSIKELKQMGDDVPDDIELHKPYIDRVLINCPKCKNKKMQRVTEVIDCWFDSGAMPFAQWHYPFENEKIFKENFPSDFISEAIDQTRGWFYSLLAISTLLFDNTSYKNVIVLGHIQDKDGQKMSKRTGNVVDPWDVLNKQGSDALRLYFYTSGAMWLPNKFNEDAINEYQRKFMVTLWNTYAFYVLYANTESFDYTKYKLEYNKLSITDKWILSKFNSLAQTVDIKLENYQITESSRALFAFLDDLSNWYIRMNRKRFWQKDMPQDKINAFMTLFTVLHGFIRLSAPFVPFITEEIYLNLVKSMDKKAPDSVHMCDFSEFDKKHIDVELESNMKLVMDVIEQGRACRNFAQIKIRQPLAKMFIQTKQRFSAEFGDIVKGELNIKDFEFVDSIKSYMGYMLKPNHRTVGSKYGRLIPKISKILEEKDASLVVELFDKGQTFNMNIDGTEVELSKEDVIIDTVKKEGFYVLADEKLPVILETKLTDELIEEGFVREIISKIQNMRKEEKFEVEDRINLYYTDDNKQLKQVFDKNKAKIANEVLALNIKCGIKDGLQEKELNINKEKIKCAIEKA